MVTLHNIPVGAVSVDPVQESCETCRFAKIVWREGDAVAPSETFDGLPGTRHATHIVCRRRPPIMVPEWGWSQPGMTVGDWCGEHQAVALS